METNDSNDINLNRLRTLQSKQINALNINDWTETDRQELLSLQKSFKNKPFQMTQEHYNSLKRQSVADTGNNPPLTDKERKLIQEINSVKK